MPGRELNLLSLDGGGIRGLSSLHILRQLMETIRVRAGLDGPPKPCDYFDMIGGTSTGGLLAIMLGRMKMTVDDCIEAYAALSDRVFKKKHHRVGATGNIQGRFDSLELERAIKEIVMKCGLDKDELLQDTLDTTCKVFVCATSHRTSEIVHLTSYRRSRGGGDRLRAVKIWEAARATSAAPSFFDPITISMGTYKEEFVDGATGANNPIQELWNEAKDAWDPEPLEQNINSIVSIGTGVPSVEPFKIGLLGVGQTLVRISTETEQTAEIFQRAHSELDDSNRYFRFNVRNGLEHIGLEDSSQRDAIMTLTERYVQSQDVFKLMKQCGKCLAERELSQMSLMVGNTWQLQEHRQHKSPRNSLPKLSRYNHEKVHRRLSSKRLKGSGMWFLERPEFQAWLNGSGGSLWCSGIVGAGKTMIVTAVVEAAKDKSRISGDVVVHYYCEPAQREMLRASDLFKSLIKQGLMYLQMIQQPYLKTIMVQVEDLYRDGGPGEDLEDVVDIFSNLFKYLETATYIIDGLDELDYKEVAAILDTFRDLFQKRSQQKLYISSRREIHQNIDVGRAIPDTVHLPISQSDNSNDIRHYVDMTMAEKSTYVRSLTEDETLMQNIKSQLLSRANGMFLWVKLQMEALWDDCETDNDIRNALDNLPQNLDSTYHRCLERIKRHNNTNHALKVFKWVGCASRPLHIAELKEALAFTLEDQKWESGRIQNTKLIIGRCANLVVLDAFDQQIRFAHPSVQRFLTKSGTPDYAFQVALDQGQLECGEFSINYLNFSDFGLQLQKSDHTSVVVPTNFAHSVIAPTKSTVVNMIKTAATLGRRTLVNQESVRSLQFHTIGASALAPDTSKFGFLPYALENWTTDTRLITNHSQMWSKFRDLAIQPNNSWKIHPWSSGGQSRDSHLHGLLGWAVNTRHMPLLQLLLDLGSECRVRDFCDLPIINEGIPPLHLASKLGYEDVLSLLLRFCKVNALDHERRTAIHYAAQKGHSDCTAKLLSLKKVAIDHKDVDGRTALHLAARSGHAAVVRQLLNLGAKVGVKDRYGLTEVDDAVDSGDVEVVRLLLKGPTRFSRGSYVYTPLLRAVELGHLEIVKLMVAEEGNISNECSNLLPIAAQRGHLEVVKLLIVRDGIKLNLRDENRQAALIEAVENEHLEVVELLIKQDGVNVNSRSKFGEIPFFKAVKTGNTEIMKLLIEKEGVDLNVRNEDGDTSLLVAASWGNLGVRHSEVVKQLINKDGVDLNSRNKEGYTPLLAAARWGKSEVVRQLINKDGVDLNSRNKDGDTPLLAAARWGKSEVVRQLIDKDGVDLNSMDEDGDTPLLKAVKWGNSEVIKQLIDKDGVDLNCRNKDGDTPLLVAASWGNLGVRHSEVVKQLIEKDGVDLHVKNKSGATALKLAVEDGRRDIIELLKSKMSAQS